MMLCSPGLAISLPPEELGSWQFPCSVFGREAMRLDLLAPALQTALQVVLDACDAAQLQPLFVARPEMFTHDCTLAWLREQLGGITNHLAFSTGQALRLVPGLRNHVFFYKPGSIGSTEAVARLQRRVPELLAGLAGQVWTGVSVPRLGGPVPAVALFPNPGKATFAATAFPFSISGDDDRHAQSAGIAYAAVPRRLTYIPLTEVACADTEFMGMVAGRISRGLFSTGGRVLLRLPELGARGTLAGRLQALRNGLARSSVRLPDAQRDTVLATETDLHLSEDWFDDGSLELLLHHSVEVWRHPANFYARAKKIAVFDDPPATTHGDRLHVLLQMLGALDRPPLISARLSQAAEPRS